VAKPQADYQRVSFIVVIACAFASLAASFWPNMVPYK
jgi:hypothetical protein